MFTLSPPPPDVIKSWVWWVSGRLEMKYKAGIGWREGEGSSVPRLTPDTLEREREREKRNQEDVGWFGWAEAFYSFRPVSQGLRTKAHFPLTPRIKTERTRLSYTPNIFVFRTGKSFTFCMIGLSGCVSESERSMQRYNGQPPLKEMNSVSVLRVSGCLRIAHPLWSLILSQDTVWRALPLILPFPTIVIERRTCNMKEWLCFANSPFLFSCLAWKYLFSYELFLCSLSWNRLW